MGVPRARPQGTFLIITITITITSSLIPHPSYHIILINLILITSSSLSSSSPSSSPQSPVDWERPRSSCCALSQPGKQAVALRYR